MKYEDFRKEFVPEIARKTKQLNTAYWILETTGSQDAANLKAELDTELKILLSCPKTYQNLLTWEKEAHDPVSKRELNILVRTFKQNQIAKNLLEEISQKEADLAQTYASFRPDLDGKKVSENDILKILKNEKNPEKRKKAWEASKQIGEVLSPQILALVHLRNQSARDLGYSDYFQMQLELQEVDGAWLLKTLEDLAQRSDKSYLDALSEIERRQAERFAVPISELGPWAWNDPFCQEDPLDTAELDQLTHGVDLAKTCAQFYQRMGIDVQPILDRSDMFERPGKNQHAFCIHLDRQGDVRTLNNVQPSIKWLETVLHELGHAIYELGFDSKLSWLLRDPPHMITTEAMALIAGRQAYRSETLERLVGSENEPLRRKADRSLQRRQLIFSRWVLVMTMFESELYRDPSQNLNELWWRYVEKYQKIRPPKNRNGKADWAAKYHIGLAPVYYFSYLLGEMFASSIQEAMGNPPLDTPKVGKFLNEKLFAPGNRFSWSELVKHVTGKPLTADSWLKEFAP